MLLSRALARSRIGLTGASLVGALSLAGCDGEPEAPPPPRVAAVKATPATDKDLAAFCEELPAPDQAKMFVWPTLEGATPAPSGKWTWVNVWATWCGPCVEEMPMLVEWQRRMEAEGASFELQFLSVDARAEDVARYKKAHSDLPIGTRVKDFAGVAPWLGQLGIDAATSIPIHFFVDAQQRLRCTRIGSVGSADYERVKALVRK